MKLPRIEPGRWPHVSATPKFPQGDRGVINTGTDWRYIYTADNERFWAYRVGGGDSVWTLRDLNGKVLREYDAHVSWTTFKDYVYRDGQLLASSHTSGDASWPLKTGV